MIQLSEHFNLEEFDQDAPIPAECMPMLSRLCQEVLEPVRAQFGAQEVTSGYRPPADNAAAHGQANSEHIYTSRKAAADLEPLEATPRAVFDWMRTNPNLPYHQLILEHSANGSSVVHVSMNLDMPGVRSVLEGATHNAGLYTKVDHVAYQPPSTHEEAQDAATAT